MYIYCLVFLGGFFTTYKLVRYQNQKIGMYDVYIWGILSNRHNSKTVRKDFSYSDPERRCGKTIELTIVSCLVTSNRLIR